jgi:RES domain-containing protein
MPVIAESSIDRTDAGSRGRETILVVDDEDVSVNLRYLEIEAPDALAIEDVDTSGIGQSWRTDLEATRRAGDRWLRSARTALLRVPSVIVPADLERSAQPAAPRERTHSRHPHPQPRARPAIAAVGGGTRPFPKFPA